MIGLGGSIRLAKGTRVNVRLADVGIELELAADGVDQTYPIAFDDAEHLAALLIDLARVTRHRSGVGDLVVA
ncbi:hypothetical protein [Rhodococcus sp. B10]|uniref:hypothetical protein n=1 Tax=Rhodococcus sp. B10 TaxID=2695876 RepID=UPI00143020B0|nr:hypothetical protein [Rhodococcus sp. B10]NIL74424.1 hypothetical protein [Rhodococcus sp. B10]